MRNPIDDEQLQRMLSAARADADPAVWTRARDRIEARATARAATRFEALWDWMSKPAAVAASIAVLLVTAGAMFPLARQLVTTDATESTSFVESLLEENGTTSTPPTKEPATTTPPDSGDRS